MPDTTMTQVRRITLRLPPILAARMDAAVRARVADNRKFSLNDWIEEACRAYLDGAAPKADILGSMQRKAGGHAAGLPVTESRYEYDEEYAANLEVTGTIPNPVDPSVTFPTVVIPTTRRTAAEIAASIKGVSLGIPKPTAAEPEPKPTGTGPLAGEHLDGW